MHKIANNVVCATSKASDQPAHMRSLIRAFASRLRILEATERTQFGDFKLKRRLQRLVQVYTCQNVKLLEISCGGSYEITDTNKGCYMYMYILSGYGAEI